MAATRKEKATDKALKEKATELKEDFKEILDLVGDKIEEVGKGSKKEAAQVQKKIDAQMPESYGKGRKKEKAELNKTKAKVKEVVEEAQEFFEEAGENAKKQAEKIKKDNMGSTIKNKT